METAVVVVRVVFREVGHTERWVNRSCDDCAAPGGWPAGIQDGLSSPYTIKLDSFSFPNNLHVLLLDPLGFLQFSVRARRTK